jgi:two-component system, NtrC family, response regulator AtoC
MSSQGGLELALLELSRIVVFPLPASGRVTIGRAPDSDVCIDDASVSRKHAVLHIGGTLQLEDLDSSNGTFIRRSGRPADSGITTQDMVRVVPGQPMDIPVGEALRLGSKLLVVRPAPAPAQPAGRPSGIIPVVEDPGMRALYALAEKVATSGLTVLILGETGVGKEVLAETIHRRSPRAQAPFLRLNCAALSESLLESELFGHEAGAFTGALRAKAGLLQSAEGGTVFLDEVGELPPGFQVKLLRVLEDRKVTRVGGLKPFKLDVRFVAATNRNLEAEIKKGTFRQDLFFRLNGMTLVVPPLRERRSEIRDLARTFATRAAEQLGRPAPALSAAGLARLERHPWPGNIRELRNVIERAVVLCAGSTLTDEHLSGLGESTAPPGSSAATATLDEAGPLRGEIEALERQRILDMLARCGGNQTEAARQLGISRRTLVSRLGDYGVPRPRKR